MKKLKSLAKIVVAAAFLSIAITGCSLLFPEDSNGTNGSNSSKQTDSDNPIKGPLTVEETWPGKDDAGNSITYFINETYLIQNGGSLTIQEGAIVKFGSNGGIKVNNQTITANGVIFTSWRDPRGRKINTAGTAEPAPGDWKQIYIYGGVAKFTNCEFSYGGSSSSTVEVVKGSNNILGKARIDSCSFKNNFGSKSIPDRDTGVKAALKYGSSCVYDKDKNCVTNTNFENNVWPVSMPADFYISGTNTFSGNEYEFVYINYYAIKDATTWDYISIPYLFSDNDTLKINANATLTINGGNKEGVDKSTLVTTVCFVNGGLHINENGTLKVNGYVKFTNNPKNPEIEFTGIECYTYRKWSSSGSDLNRTVKLISNSSTNPDDENYFNVTVEHFQETGKYATDAANAEQYRRPIQQTNNYDAFYYKYN